MTMQRCQCCGQVTKQLKKCYECGDDICQKCGVNGKCKECVIVNDKCMVRDYFIDKYATKMLPVLMIFIFLSVGTQAIEFRNERISQDLTGFEWEFDNPWLEEKSMYNDFLQLYVTNQGCKDITIKMYALTPVTYTDEACSPKYVKTCESTINGTNEQETCFDHIEGQTCVPVQKTIIEAYDLEKTDFLLGTKDRILVKGERKAKTGSQSCDMNFIYDDGLEKVDTADYGREWWNTTWQRKYSLNISSVSSPPYIPVRILLNSSYIRMSDCQSNGGDVRIVNATEDGMIPFNLSSWNSTQGIIYINQSAQSSYSFFLYCNASSAQATNSVPLIETILKDNIVAFYDLDGAVNTSEQSSLSGYNLTREGNVPSKTGIISGSRGEFVTGTAPVLKNLTAWYNTSDGFTVEAFINYTGARAGSNDNIVADNISGAPLAGYMGFQLLDENTAAGMSFYMAIGGGANCEAASTIATTTPNTAYQMVGVYDDTNNLAKIYINGTYVANCSLNATKPYLGTYGIQVGNFLGAAGNEADAYNIDLVGLWTEDLSNAKIAALYTTSLNGRGTRYPFYAETSYNVSSGQNFLEDTVITPKLLVDGVIRANNSVLEGEDFRFYAQLNYSENGTLITGSDAWCNYTGINVSYEKYNYTSGVNLSVCGSGCNVTDNYRVYFTGMPTSGFEFDEFKFRLCKQGAATSVTINSNCSSATQTLSTEMPLCTAGQLNFSWKNTACSGKSDFFIDVNNTQAFAQRVRLIDGFVGVDRFRNDSDNMTYWSNVSGFVSPDEHEHYSHGNRSAYFNCYVNISRVNNASSSLNYAVQNDNPTAFFNLISDYYNGPLAFANNIVMKYPIAGTLNVSATCDDDDINLSASYLNLTFTNGTVIQSDVFTVPGILVNYTISNFSVNALRSSKLHCEDTGGLTSDVVRNFNASNLYPIPYFINASGGVYSYTPTFAYYCYDPDWTAAVGANVRTWIFANGTYMATNGMMNSNATVTYNTALLGANYWQLDVVCYDSLFNSTSNATLFYTYSPACIPVVTGILDNERYRNNNITVGFNCSNSLNLTSCDVRINKFASESMNCTEQLIILELGRNDLVFNLTTTTGNSITQNYTVYAKRLNEGGLGAYAVPVILALTILFLLWAYANFMRMGSIALLIGLGGCVLGVTVLAWSFWAGGFIMVASIMWALIEVMRE